MPQFHAVSIGQGLSILTPSADGTDGQALITDGSGGLSFSTVGAASPLTLTASSASEKPLTIVAATSQTANLQEWQDSSGNVIAAMTPGNELLMQSHFGLYANPSPGGSGTRWKLYSPGDGVDVMTVGQWSRPQFHSPVILAGELYMSKAGPGGSYSARITNQNGGKTPSAYAGPHSIKLSPTYGQTLSSNDRHSGYVQINLSAGGASSSSGDQDGGDAGQFYVELAPGGAGAGTGATGMEGRAQFRRTDDSVLVMDVTHGSGVLISELHCTAGSASDTPVTIVAATSQTANLQEWQDSSGNVLAKVDSSGALYSSAAYLKSSGAYYWELGTDTGYGTDLKRNGSRGIEAYASFAGQHGIGASGTFNGTTKHLYQVLIDGNGSGATYSTGNNTGYIVGQKGGAYASPNVARHSGNLMIKTFDGQNTGSATSDGGIGGNIRIVYGKGAAGIAGGADGADGYFQVEGSDGTIAIKTDWSATAGDTRLLLYDVDNGQLERVTVGAADSGGSGYKVLRIPN